MRPSPLSLVGGQMAAPAAAGFSEPPPVAASRPESPRAHIEARYRALSDGLDSSVDVAELAQRVCDGLYDGVSEREVDELMAETAAYQASMHPDFGRLAARVAVSRLHAQTDPSFLRTLRELHAHADPSTGGPAPLVSAELLALAEELAPVLEPALRHERDFDFDYFGLRTLLRSYLLGEEGGARERPQQMLMRVALCVHGRDVQAVLQSYDLMSRGLFTHATPTMFNAGCPRQQLASSLGLKCRLHCLTAPPHLPTRRLQGLRPLLRIPERSPPHPGAVQWPQQLASGRPKR